jgi:hypothetical protein
VTGSGPRLSWPVLLGPEAALIHAFLSYSCL